MLTPGTRLGPYEISAPIGAGGMGEVYRAKDPRLGRDVAIKVLPATFSGDSERLLRFEREAKAASALNHPNILTIYDVGRENATPYVVSELLEGENLRDRMRHGPLPPRKAIDYAVQIAKGLAAAHEKGIVHRDLKPENLFVTPDGRIKILDFGLAKLGISDALGEKPGQTPSLAPTETGVVLGTAGYMSPEQVRGLAVDHRTDVFSLGAIVYEMLSGRRAFDGTTGADKVSAILNADPSPLSAPGREVSPALEHIVRRCLEKNPSERFHSAHDMAFALEAVSSDSGPVAVPARTPGAKRRPWPVLAGAAALAVLAVAGWLLLPKGPPRLGPKLSYRTLQVPANKITYPGISQDGKWVAFPAADDREHWDVYFMNVNGGEARRVTTDSSLFVVYVDISPDGSQIAYSTVSSRDPNRAQVRVVSALGGRSKLIAKAGIALRWRPDGARVGFIKQNGNHYELWSVSPDGGEARREFADTLGSPGRLSFDWSPDGKSIVWIRSFNRVYEEMVVCELKGGKERQLTHDRKNIDEVCWTRQGNIVFSSNRDGNSNLWMMRASGGPATHVTKGSGPDIGMRVSADGKTLVYLQQQPISHLWISDFEKPNPRQVTRDDLVLGSPSLSPDHQRIAVPVFDPDPIRRGAHIYVMNRDGSDRRQVTSGDEVAGPVSWTWDGKSLVYSSWPRTLSADSASIYMIDADNPGTPKWIGKGQGFSWKDPRTLLVTRQTRSYELPLDGGPGTNASEDSSFNFLCVAGRLALYTHTRHDREGIWMRVLGPTADSAAAMKRILGLGLPMFASWDGRFIYCFADPARSYKLMLPDLKEVPYPSRFTGLSNASNGGFSFDNREIVYTEQRLASKLVLIENLR